MKALRLHGYHGEQHISLDDVAAPTPGPDDVLVRVAAAAVNPLDAKLARGYFRDVFPLKLPYVVGTDLAGTVESVGARVTAFRPGDRVMARIEATMGGAFAECAVVPSWLVVPVPTQFGFEEAAAFGTIGGTAWQGLFEVAQINASTRLLVTGGAGGVGGMAVRLAASIGARVFATAHARGLEFAKRLGAERVFDAEGKLDLDDVDVVFDTAGGEGQHRLFDVIRDAGMLASIVQPPDGDMGRTRGIDARFVFHESNGSRFAVATNYCAAHQIKPSIDCVMPLEAGPEAIARVASGKARGKVVLQP
ncbi:NADP-dependent oxidoreductase [Pendulispora brunnea]|uniref:NADP-dependent oxidoreductase n=1 Tax=Pendulispora brunnea TaxID=2905690 RepID=A0ABZ2KCL2_9BACT